MLYCRALFVYNISMQLYFQQAVEFVFSVRTWVRPCFEFDKCEYRVTPTNEQRVLLYNQ